MIRRRLPKRKGGNPPLDSQDYTHRDLRTDLLANKFNCVEEFLDLFQWCKTQDTIDAKKIQLSMVELAMKHTISAPSTKTDTNITIRIDSSFMPTLKQANAPISLANIVPSIETVPA